MLAPGDEGDSKFPEVRDVPEGRVDLNFISLIHSGLRVYIPWAEGAHSLG